MKNSSDISFTFIYTRYYKQAFRFAKSYVHDEAVAEDIASEALIALWEKVEITSVEEITPLLFTMYYIFNSKHLRFSPTGLSA